MWIVRNGYIELQAPQRSEPWRLARKRITASNVEGILGLSTFKTRESVISEILGGPEKSFSPEAIQRMDLGTKMEEPMRKFHMSFLPTATIVEPSLCLGLKWYDIPFRDGHLSDYYPSQLSDPLHPNWFLGGSPDGIITFPDGRFRNLELKYTQKGYKPLADHCKDPKKSFRYTPYPTKAYASELKELELGTETGVIDYFPHIWRSHFYQMQTCMFITRAPECDYGVGSDNSYYRETVYYDEKLWVNYIYRELVKIIEDEIKPRMTSEQTRLFSNQISEIISICPKDQELKVSCP